MHNTIDFAGDRSLVIKRLRVLLSGNHSSEPHSICVYRRRHCRNDHFRGGYHQPFLSRYLDDSRHRPAVRPPHVWMAPDMQELFCVRDRGRLRSCVRPFCAVLHGPLALMGSADRVLISPTRPKRTSCRTSHAAPRASAIPPSALIATTTSGGACHTVNRLATAFSPRILGRRRA